MKFILSGAMGGLLSVVLGAFAAHALKTHLSEYSISIFETAVKYQMYHSLALIVVGIISLIPNQPDLKWAGRFFIIGIVIFSGSLYALSLTDVKWLGAVTPLGGLCFILGWFLLGYPYFKKPNKI